MNRVFLFFKKLQRQHRYSHWKEKLFKQGLTATPSSLPAILFRGLFSKSCPFSFTCYAPTDMYSVLFPFHQGIEICRGCCSLPFNLSYPGLLFLTTAS